MKHSTQTLLAIGLSGFALVGCKAHFQSSYSFDYEGETSSFRKQGEIPAAIEVASIEHRFGDVHISPGAPGEQPSWRWELTTWADEEATARAYMDQITLETITEGERMSWKLLLPERPGKELRGVKSKLWLTLSDSIDVRLKNAHGDASIQGIGGAVRSDVSHGAASYQSLTGDLSLEHAHGDMELKDVEECRLDLRHSKLEASDLSRLLRLDAEHSSVSIDGLPAGLKLDASHSRSTIQGLGGTLDFDGSHSKLKLSGDPDELLLESSHGDLDIHCLGSQLSFVKADIEHCDLTLTVPANSNVRVTSDTSHGSAHSELSSNGEGKLIRIDVENEHGDFRLKAGR